MNDDNLLLYLVACLGEECNELAIELCNKRIDKVSLYKEVLDVLSVYKLISDNINEFAPDTTVGNVSRNNLTKSLQDVVHLSFKTIRFGLYKYGHDSIYNNIDTILNNTNMICGYLEFFKNMCRLSGIDEDIYMSNKIEKVLMYYKGNDNVKK